MMRASRDLDLPISSELQEKSYSVTTCQSSEYKNKETVVSKFHWISRPMGAKLDLSDKDALYEILDQS